MDRDEWPDDGAPTNAENALVEQRFRDREANPHAFVPLGRSQRLVINSAERGKTTRNHVLELAMTKARERFAKKQDASAISSEVVFNVQTPRTEPLLCVPDYLAWTVQRVFERGETRHYDFVRERISLVVDLYDAEKYAGSRNYYTPKRPLTAENKLGPPVS